VTAIGKFLPAEAATLLSRKQLRDGDLAQLEDAAGRLGSCCRRRSGRRLATPLSWAAPPRRSLGECNPGSAGQGAGPYRSPET
jgi:hypothetical protein